MTATVRWVGGIIGMLGAGVVAMVILAVSAGRADARRVLPEYDTKALHYDDVLTQQAHNRALGWTATLGLDGDDVIVALHDARGLAITDAMVEVRLYHRAHADQPLQLTLRGGRDGHYRAAAGALRAGIHQLDATVQRGDDVFTRSAWADAGGAAP